MNRRRTIALSPEEQDEMLRTSHTIVLSSLDRWGYPHSVPMWYVVREGHVHMTTYAKSQKALNLSRNPRCSVMVETGEQYQELRGILIRGRAELHTSVDDVLAVLLLVHAKQGFTDATPELAEAMRAHAAKRVVIEVIPERVSSWDHRKLGGVY